MAVEFFAAAFPWLALGLLAGLVCSIIFKKR